MKNLKLILLLVVAIFSFGTAEAQSVVLRVGSVGPSYPPAHRSVVYHKPARYNRPAHHYRAAPDYRPATRYRTGPRGRYVYNGRHYAHRTVYYKNHHRYYRYY
jgi:hypothetical protein